MRYCESLSFAGHDDWRLPNVRELQSIVDFGRYDPAIDPVFGALGDGYWSSTTSNFDHKYSFLVLFDEGMVLASLGKVGDNYVRAVRSAQ